MAFANLLSKRSALRTKNTDVTPAAQLTLRQSLWPLTIVTVLFFLWGFAYGLLDTLNKHFQNTLGITRARSSGLQAAYFGAYPIVRSISIIRISFLHLCPPPSSTPGEKEDKTAKDDGTNF